MKKNKSIERALRKIISVFNDQNTDQITIQRKYLPEFITADLLEISEFDGLPVVKPFVLEYFQSKGIEIKYSSNEAQLEKKDKENHNFLDRIEELEVTVMRLEALTPEEELKRDKQIRELENIKKEIKYPESKPKSIKEIKYPKSEEERETSESKNERLKESLEKGKSPLIALVKDLQKKLNKQLSVINNLRSELTNRGQISEKLKIKDKEVEILTSEIIELNQKLENLSINTDDNQGNSITLKLIEDLPKLFKKAKNQIIELKQKLV